MWLKETPTSRPVQALFATGVECSISICSVVALLYAAFTGLFRAWLAGQAVSGWYLAIAVISTLQPFVRACTFCCATCGSARSSARVSEGARGFSPRLREQ